MKWLLFFLVALLVLVRAEQQAEHVVAVEQSTKDIVASKKHLQRPSEDEEKVHDQGLKRRREESHESKQEVVPKVSTPNRDWINWKPIHEKNRRVTKAAEAKAAAEAAAAAKKAAEIEAQKKELSQKEFERANFDRHFRHIVDGKFVDAEGRQRGFDEHPKAALKQLAENERAQPEVVDMKAAHNFHPVLDQKVVKEARDFHPVTSTKKTHIGVVEAEEAGKKAAKEHVERDEKERERDLKKIKAAADAAKAEKKAEKELEHKMAAQKKAAYAAKKKAEAEKAEKKAAKEASKKAEKKAAKKAEKEAEKEAAKIEESIKIERSVKADTAAPTHVVMMCHAITEDNLYPGSGILAMKNIDPNFQWHFACGEHTIDGFTDEAKPMSCAMDNEYVYGTTKLYKDCGLV